jgi:hypothetical protein
MRTENQAKELLRAVGSRYAGLATYRDHGRVLRAGGTEPVVQFRTLFARDAGLYFEFTRAGRTEFVSRPMTDPEGLREVLAGATGISTGTAHTIPALLLPWAGNESWSLLQLSAVRVISRPRDQSATARWNWIAGSGWAGQPLRVAVDPETLLIWRLEDDGLGEARPHSTEYVPDAVGPVLSDEILTGHPGGL